MTYAAIEDSVESGSPVELYEFTQGVKSYRYATCEQDFPYGGFVFTGSSIKRDRIVLTNDIFKDGVKLNFPRDHEFASSFLTFAPDNETSVTIYRGHYEDLDIDFRVYWKGRVVSQAATKNTVELLCESLFTTVQRPGLRARFEYICRHTLYGTGCGLSASSYRTESTIASFDTAINLIIPAASAQPDGYFIGGILVTSDGVRRFITAHTGTQITISRPLSNTNAGQPVEIYAGCDHTHQTCTNKFANHLNFGGFPYIPATNIFKFKSLV